jgi:hypothetical protein
MNPNPHPWPLRLYPCPDPDRLCDRPASVIFLLSSVGTGFFLDEGIVLILGRIRFKIRPTLLQF